MSVSSGGWLPTLPNSLQQQLNSLESTQNSYVAGFVTKEAQNLYQQTILEATPIVGQQSNLNQEVNNLQSLVSALQNLQNAIQTVATASTWNAVSATSSNSSALTIQANAGAPQATVSFTVNKLAQGQISLINNMTASAPDEATGISQGIIVLDGGLGSATININAGDSLNTLAADINAYSSQTGVQASIVQNGSGYQLMLISNQSGQTQGAFSFGTGTTATINGNTLSLTTIQNATDASLTLGSGLTLTSATNTFQNALPNTTITVQQTGSGTITISPDTQAAINAMNNFFNAYNAVEKMVYSGGSVANTPIGQLIAAQLPNLITGTYNPGNNGGLDALSQLGIITTPGGFSISDGTFSSTNPPTIGWSSLSGVSGVSLPEGVSLPDGQSTFKEELSSQMQNMENLLGVTSTGYRIPDNTVLGALSTAIQSWLNDLNGGTVNGETTPGIISNLQNEMGNSGSPVPGSLQYQLNQLNAQYQSQIQALVNQWSLAQASILQAQQQLLQLQAIEALAQSSTFQTSALLGG